MPRLDVKTVELVLREVAVTQAVSPSLASNIQVDEILQHLTGDMIYRLKTYVQAQHLANDHYTHVEHVPATWWQHWKHSHDGRFARWLKRRKPVLYRDLTFMVAVESYAAFPDSTVVEDPRLGQPRLWQYVTYEMDES